MSGQEGRCNQHGQTTMIWLKTCCLIWLAMCNHDLHWHWINWTLLCDTIEVSMLRPAWVPIAQHVFQPALTGRLELISRMIVSCDWEQRLLQWAHFAKNCLLRTGVQEVTAISQKILHSHAPKNGVQHATAIFPIPQYTRLRYIGSTRYLHHVMVTA